MSSRLLKQTSNPQTKRYDSLIVGAGLFGAVVAQVLAEAGESVLVLDQNPHIGGLCHTFCPDEGEIIVNSYGTHIFSTNNLDIWTYVQKFSEWTPFYFSVRTNIDGQFLPFPLNLESLNSIFKSNLDSASMIKFIEAQKVDIESPSNFEEVCLKKFGSTLYKASIYGYAKKQWGTEPKNLPVEMMNRSRLRFSNEDRYYLGQYTAYPTGGFTTFFEKLLNDTDVQLSTNFLEDLSYWQRQAKKIIYTGPLDAYFNYCYGETGWRNLEFEIERHSEKQIQPCINVHHPSENQDYTKTSESKNLKDWSLVDCNHSFLAKEYYKEFTRKDLFLLKPFRTHSSVSIHKKYLQKAGLEKNFFWGGRTADFTYYDMDQTIAVALKLARQVILGGKARDDGADRS